jgi:hypothetical protein
MDQEKKIEAQLNSYQELAKQNKDIDLTGLMMNALQNSEANYLSRRQKRWAYLVSIGLPPFGLLFAVKFFMSDKDDAKSAAWTCVILTIFSILAFYFFSKILFSSAGISPTQLQQIKPSDVQQLYQ